MAIDTSSTSMSVSTPQSVSQNNSPSLSSKTSSDTSFKDEMDKVTSTESKDQKDVKDTKKENKETNVQKTEDKNNKNVTSDKNKDESKDLALQANISMNNIAQTTFNDVNQMLIDDIQQMAETYDKFGEWNCTAGNNKFTLSISETDAQFFIDLANSNDMSIQNMTAQAQTMINSGADVREVQQGYQVSQALLNALNEARQTNQPIRIDFDQNVAVILRVNQNGSLSANFIPGDKIVEQYLRQNIDLLRNTFDEKNLPYTDLSYSNSSKEQNKRRRNEQQGE